MPSAVTMAVAMAVVVGCFQADSERPRRATTLAQSPAASAPLLMPRGDNYVEIEGRSTASMAPFSLCKLVRHPMFEGAGLYRVERMSGHTEEDLWNPGTMTPFTYVELSLVTEWHRASKRAVARIFGGPLPNGDVGGWRIALSVGEIVGLLLTRPWPENRNYPSIHELGLFKQGTDGGFSNGQLFTRRGADAATLGALVTKFSGAPIEDSCPTGDVQVDNSGSEHLNDPEADDVPIHVQGRPVSDEEEM